MTTVAEITYYAVLIEPGSGGYRPLSGWDTAHTSRAEAEACAAQARRQDGWSAKVIELTATEARRYGWLAEVAS